MSWKARNPQAQYQNDIRKIRRQYGLGYRQAQAAYRQAKETLKWKSRGDVTQAAIIEAAEPKVYFFKTAWIDLLDSWLDDLNGEREIHFDFGPWGPKGEINDQADAAKTNVLIRKAGDAYNGFAEKYPAPPNTPNLWRVMEDFGYIIFGDLVQYFWQEDYSQWEKPNAKFEAPNV